MSVHVTEQDLRDDRYREGQPEDYEFRADGVVVRKDRWERGLRSVVGVLGLSRDEFECGEVAPAVKQYVEDREVAIGALHKLSCLGNGGVHGNSEGNIIAAAALRKCGEFS